jgi:RNA polymerase sigma-70 factor (ECF subfamily)
MGFYGVQRLSSDEALARKVAGGDRRAFTSIYRRHCSGLYRYCLGSLGDALQAQEALERTMRGALKALLQDRRDTALKPWLYRLAHEETGTRSPGAVDQGGRLSQVQKDLAELPHPQRGGLLMRELAGLSFEEIGLALRISPDDAQQTVYEARLRMAELRGKPA